jgi:hypothetical protein
MSPDKPLSGSLGLGGVNDTVIVSPGEYTLLFVAGVPVGVFGGLFFMTVPEYPE